MPDEYRPPYLARDMMDKYPNSTQKVLIANTVALGDVVFFDHGYGRIVSIGSCWRPQPKISKIKEAGMDWLYTVKIIDSKTGEAMKCPDSRCTEGCPICTRKLWIEQLRPMTKTDEDFYRKEGMLR